MAQTTQPTSFVPKIDPKLLENSTNEETDSMEIYMNSGFLSNCHGSCLFENGKNLMIARVMLHPLNKKTDERFIVDFRQNLKLGHIIKQSMRSCIRFEDIPNTTVRIQIDVLHGLESFHVINAVSLALINANLPMLGIVSGYKQVKDKESVLLVCCHDKIVHISLNGDAGLIDECYENCQQVRKLMIKHLKSNFYKK